MRNIILSTGALCAAIEQATKPERIVADLEAPGAVKVANLVQFKIALLRVIENVRDVVDNNVTMALGAATTLTILTDMREFRRLLPKKQDLLHDPVIKTILHIRCNNRLMQMALETFPNHPGIIDALDWKHTLQLAQTEEDLEKFDATNTHAV